MPESTLQTLNAALWDLRARCERQLRALTDAQRLLDQYRMYAHAREELKERLRGDMQHVVQLNAVGSIAAQELMELVGRLPCRVDDRRAPVHEKGPAKPSHEDE